MAAGFDVDQVLGCYFCTVRLAPPKGGVGFNLVEGEAGWGIGGFVVFWFLDPEGIRWKGIVSCWS